jgi:hypothetical protein
LHQRRFRSDGLRYVCGQPSLIAGRVGALVALSAQIETLGTQVPVPRLGECLVLIVKLPMVAIIAFFNEAAPLLDAHVIITSIERGQVRASGKTKLEAHLRVARQTGGERTEARTDGGVEGD